MQHRASSVNNFRDEKTGEPGPGVRALANRLWPVSFHYDLQFSKVPGPVFLMLLGMCHRKPHEAAIIHIHYTKKVKGFSQYLDLNTKIKAISRNSTKHLENFKIFLTCLCSVALTSVSRQSRPSVVYDRSVCYLNVR